MASIKKEWEGTGVWFQNDIFSNLNANEEKFYTTFFLQIEGLNDRQNIHLTLKSVIGNDTELLLQKDISIGKEKETFGPISINKKCKLLLDGDLDWNFLSDSKCKIKAVYSYDETSIETLRIGVFFDGTGNNAYNTQKDNIINNKTRKDDDIIMPASYVYTKDSSINNGVSNIWRLYSSFQEGRLSDNIYQIKTYVEGIGTKKGSEDSLFTMATGWSLPGDDKRGIIDKTDDAVNQLTQIIKKNEGDFKNIEFCIFGFSRGAAAARHFANRLKKQDGNILKAFESKKIIIKFMGLFDTVAATLALSQFDFDVGDSKTGAVDISLEENICNDIFHITAGHEVRENFSLNHITNNYQTELKLPGVHSDIGGSYKDKDKDDNNPQELLNISQILYKEVGIEVDNKETSSYIATKEEMNNLLAHPMWGGIYKLSNIYISTTKKKMSGPFFLYSNVLKIKRDIVLTGLDRVSFQAMRYYAAKCGLAFNTLTDDIAEDIPSDLQHLYEQACLEIDTIYSEKKSVSLASNISPELGAKYIHHSSFFNEKPSNYVVESQSLLDSITYKLLLTNRPHETYFRREFNEDGTKYG